MRGLKKRNVGAGCTTKNKVRAEKTERKNSSADGVRENPRRGGRKERLFGFACWISILVASVVLFLGLSVLRIESLGLETKLSSLDKKIAVLTAEKKELEANLSFVVSPGRVWGGGERLGMKIVRGSDVRSIFVD